MKFLIDAQLPRRMADWLIKAGFDAIHTLELPEGNRTSDARIAALSTEQNRILITKDSDFVNEHILNGQPAKLLFVSTGNINNRDLHLLLSHFLTQIHREFQSNSFLELSGIGIFVRG